MSRAVARSEPSQPTEPSEAPERVGLDGAKKVDYAWTVLAVDPLALPLARALARRQRPSPDQVTIVSLGLGLLVGPAYATGSRLGLVAGAALFYVSFVLDCVDGKLARARGVSSPRGKALDELADGARRASGTIGLAFYLWSTDASDPLRLLVVVFGVLSFYFIEISGAERTGAGSRWSRLLARRRLLPNPGMPEISAVTFVVAPALGLVGPGLVVGTVLVIAGVLVSFLRRLRAGPASGV